MSATAGHDRKKADAGLVEAAEPETDQQHARTLAAQLVRHLGICEAQRTCEDNEWSNVLAAVRLYDDESD